MGTILASEIDTAARAILGAIDTALLPTATMLNFTNAAYIEDIAFKYDVLELRTSATANTTQNTRTFTPSISTCLRLRAIQNTAGQVLKEITPEQEVRGAVPVAVLTSSSAFMTGVPTHYIRVGGAAYSTLSFHLYPVPDAAYPLTVYFVSRPTVLAAGNYTAIDTLWDQAILHYATSRAAAYLRMYDDAIKLREYASVLAKNAQASFDIPHIGADDPQTVEG